MLILFLLWTRGVTLSVTDPWISSMRYNITAFESKNKQMSGNYICWHDPLKKAQAGSFRIQRALSQVRTHDLKVRVTVLIGLDRERSISFRTKRLLSTKCDRADINGDLVSFRSFCAKQKAQWKFFTALLNWLVRLSWDYRVCKYLQVSLFLWVSWKIYILHLKTCGFKICNADNLFLQLYSILSIWIIKKL